MNKISQREARKYRAELNALREAIRGDRSSYGRMPFGGQFLLAVNVDTETRATIKAARKLKHRVVVDIRDDGAMILYGLPLISEIVKP